MTRTWAWLAKPATASRMIERVGTWRAGVLREGEFGEYSTYFSLAAEVAAAGGADIDTPAVAGFLPRKIAKRQ
jgi:hypothetical protein